MHNAKETVNELLTRATAIGALFGIAMIHAGLMPHGFDDIRYLGLAYIGAVVASLELAAAPTQPGDAGGGRSPLPARARTLRVARIAARIVEGAGERGDESPKRACWLRNR